MPRRRRPPGLLVAAAAAVLLAFLFGYFFAVGISRPIRGLAASTRAIIRRLAASGYPKQ